MTLTAEQHEDAAYVEGLMTAGEPFVYDLSDERQYRHIVRLHHEAGNTPERRPGLHAGLAKARAVHAAAGPMGLGDPDPDGFVSGGAITNLSMDKNTQLAAGTGFAGFTSGAVQVHAILEVLDSVSGQQLASGAATDFGNGTYVPVATTPGQNAGAGLVGVLSVSYQLQAGDPFQSFSVRSSLALNVQGDPVVEQPVKTLAKAAPPIIIAIGRGYGSASDVDYWLAWDSAHTTYEVPFVGNVDFTSNVPWPLVLGQNLYIFGKLARKSPDGKGGHKDLEAPEQQHILSTMQASGTNLSWNLPAPLQHQQNPPHDHGNTIHWGELGWDSGEYDYLTIQFAVELQPGVWGYATVQSSDSPDKDPLDGTKNIFPLAFVYSCLAAGTPVRLADGSDKAIELIERGDAVRGPDGTERTVQYTRTARHRGRVLRLFTEAGELVVSRNHPVLTSDGPRMAEQLAAGDEVLGEGAPLRVVEVREEKFDGVLCNLALTAAGEPVDADRNSFLASGIAVGDYELQIQREYDTRLSKEAVLARLEPEYHQDYLNFLEEQQAAHV